MEHVLPVLLLGFFLGMRHATDADHVVAVSTIVSRERSLRAAGLIGALWGVGHTVTILAVGGSIVLFGVVISPRVGLTMEFSVALMLVLLGAMNLTGAMSRIEEAVHEHRGDAQGGAPPHRSSPRSGAPHTTGAAHVHDARIERLLPRIGRLRLLRPLLVGTVHGLAGSAAVALLVLTTIHDATWALLYLLVFGIGTVGGMMLLTSLMAMPMAYTADRFATIHRHLGRATGLLSLAFGIFIAYRIGIEQGLFSTHPVWEPR
jgi:high-affinity nickel-transport protein